MCDEPIEPTPLGLEIIFNVKNVWVSGSPQSLNYNLDKEVEDEVDISFKTSLIFFVWTARLKSRGEVAIYNVHLNAARLPYCRRSLLKVQSVDFN